ncbi:hypothetical protein RvY_06546 [Ramazzottius varieornatus]|uniref:alanine--tRNA ligase n=1 Tax=Ramazzottius varieornatus TaxID=947166 RepID=A0A1D1UYZ6_RAMVA|nr:hypothetical protein RvY_06546 [Ramazzottius varieornatus]
MVVLWQTRNADSQSKSTKFAYSKFLRRNVSYLYSAFILVSALQVAHSTRMKAIANLCYQQRRPLVRLGQHSATWKERRRMTTHLRRDQLTGAQIRSAFLDFFRSRDHVIVPSSTVVPKDDQSLLFVNAGMNQFKDILLGKRQPEHTRIANSQKCIRAGGKHNDLDEVGHDGRHHTYFEMLGNWSFADYFQKDACRLAYDLLVDVYGLPPDRLLMTYFGGDPELGLGPDFECREIWRQIGVPEAHIIPLGMEDNFWAMGEEGPCGPCTEIHYSPSGKSEDMLELWNLVFMQYNRKRQGLLEPLKDKHVDTGMGLERVVAVLQGKKSNYDTDLFTPVLSQIQQLTKAPFYEAKWGQEDHQGLNTSYRIIADHIRMLTVALADGVVPADRGAPFVLRKVLRRSVIILQNKFNCDPLALVDLVDTVVESLGEAYPEVASGQEAIKKTISEEVLKYKRTLEKGNKIFSDVWKKLENKMVLPADRMFSLYMHFGVPEELIIMMAKNRNMTCDLKGFYVLLDNEREKSRKARKG